MDALRPAVLVIDDEPILRRELAISLNENGLPAISAESGRAAIQIAENNQIQVAILDCRMPDMDGIEIAKILRQKNEDISLIILSAHDSPAYRQRAADQKLTGLRWLEKDLQNPEDVERAVINAVREEIKKKEIKVNVIGLLDRRLSIAIQSAELTPNQVQILKKALDFPSLVVPEGTSIPRPPGPNNPPGGSNKWDLDELLSLLTQYMDEIEANYGDPAIRDVYWVKVRDLISEHLWSAVAQATPGPYLKQLAVQLKQAVLKISAPQLTQDHIRCVLLSLGRMRSSKVDESDIAFLKREWRATGVDTLPSFEQIMREWPDLYGVEGPED